MSWSGPGPWIVTLALMAGRPYCNWIVPVRPAAKSIVSLPEVAYVMQ